MEKKSYYVGVDIGTSTITMVVGETLNNQLNILDSSIQESKLGIIDGRIHNVDVVGTAILTAKKELEESLNITITEAYVGIANEFVRCTTITEFVEVRDKQTRCITEEDLRLLSKRITDIKCESASKEQIMERIPLCYIIDGKRECQNPIGEIGSWLSTKYLVVLSNTEQMRRLSLAFQKAHLSIKKCFANTVTQPHLLLSKDEWNEGAAIVDIGGGTTDVSVVYNNKLRHIASLPIGGNAIDEDIASFGIQKRVIKSIKHRYAKALCETVGENDTFLIRKISKTKDEPFSHYNLTAIIEARLRDIAEFVLDELRYSRLIHQIKGGVILTGGVANIKHIAELFQRELNLPVRTVEEYHGLTKDSTMIVGSPAETAAISAALYGNAPCVILDKSHSASQPKIAMQHNSVPIVSKPTEPVQPKSSVTNVEPTTAASSVSGNTAQQPATNAAAESRTTQTATTSDESSANRSAQNSNGGTNLPPQSVRSGNNEEKSSHKKRRKWSVFLDKIIGYDKNTDELL